MRAATDGKRVPPTRGRLRLAWPATATTLAVLALLLVAATIPLSVLTRQSVLSNLAQAIIFLPATAAGLLIARRQPGNPIGWLLLVVSAGALITEVAGLYTRLAYDPGRHLPLGPVAVLLALSWPALLLAFGLVVLLFPEGRLPSPRWRWALRAYLAGAVMLTGGVYAVAISILAGPRVQIDASGGLAALDHPAGRTAVLVRILFSLLVILVVFWLAFVGRLALSWRDASGERRQQLKWLMAGSTVTIVTSAIPVLVSAFDPNAPAAVQAISNISSDLGTMALPVCVGMAILKYRLYDIDRIISRTLAYAIVTALLVGLYAGLVLLATRVLSFHTPVAVAASTLAAAALFNPLRRWVQLRVDRRFNRARYDADQTVAAFANRLKDAVDLDSVRAELTGVVQQSLEPAHLSIWVSRDG